MPKLTALSLSIAVLGAIWAYLALGPLAGFVLLWAGFIAWGCFFHTGGDEAALGKTIAGNLYGAVIAWIALLIVVNVPMPALGPAWPALIVGVTVFLLVIISTIPALSVVPANVYGYAATAAYALHHQGAEGTAGAMQSLLAADFANPLVIVAASMVAGALLGYASAKLTGLMTRPPHTTMRAGTA